MEKPKKPKKRKIGLSKRAAQRQRRTTANKEITDQLATLSQRITDLALRVCALENALADGAGKALGLRTAALESGLDRMSSQIDGLRQDLRYRDTGR